MVKLQLRGLEFTHFLAAKTHLMPINKGRGAFSQVEWAFFFREELRAVWLPLPLRRI